MWEDAGNVSARSGQNHPDVGKILSNPPFALCVPPLGFGGTRLEIRSRGCGVKLYHLNSAVYGITVLLKIGKYASFCVHPRS